MEATKKRATEAWLTSEYWEVGLGQVVVARFKADGEAEVGVFLVDGKCLGVKDAFYTRLSGAEYESRLLAKLRARGGLEALSPACARKLIEGAIAFARSLGLEPHADYGMAQRVLGGIKPEECERSFTFGDNGRPVYIQGPNDSPERAEWVLAQIARHTRKKTDN